MHRTEDHDLALHPRQGHPCQARRAEPGELANVRFWLRVDVLGAVDLRPLHPSKQTCRSPMSAPGAIADHLQLGDRRPVVTHSRHPLPRLQCLDAFGPKRALKPACPEIDTRATSIDVPENSLMSRSFARRFRGSVQELVDLKRFMLALDRMGAPADQFEAFR